MTDKAVLSDLRDRLMQAQIACNQVADGINHQSGSRLRGKAQGISLAISYVDEYLRGTHATHITAPDDTASPI